MMRRSGWVLACLFFLAGQVAAQRDDVRRIASAVTYVTLGSVYIGAGRTHGLAPGDTLTLSRAGVQLGRVTVTAVSSSSSLATLLGPDLRPAVGDSAVVTKRVPVVDERRPAVVSTPLAPGRDDGSNVVSGRIAVQYSGVGRVGQSPDLSQPAIVGRVDIGRLFGSTIDFRLNGRVAGDATGGPLRYGETSRWRPRLYELSLISDDPGRRYGFGLGRLLPRYVGGLGTFDGGEVYGRLGRFTAGVIAGAQANYLTSGIDADHQKIAAYLNVAWGGDLWSRSDLTIAYGQQLYRGKLDRNFTYVQTSIRFGPELSFFGSSEFDFHKGTYDGVVSRFNMTNTFITMSYAPALRWLTVSAGYDATRPVPLLESERTILDSLLDRSLRQGLRGSLSFLLPARVVISTTGTYRLPSRTTPRASSASISVRASDLFGTGFGTGAQFGTMTSVYSRGRNLSFDLDQWVTDALTLGLRLDRYDYQLTDRGGTHRTVSASLNGSWRISRAWYAAISADRVWDDRIITQRIYMELGMHF